MKIDKNRLKKKKDHQARVADLLVKVHERNENLRKKKIDVSIFKMFNKSNESIK